MVTLPDGSLFSLESLFVIERKMSLDELCSNFTKSRERFAREFSRAATAGAKVALLVENGSWEKAYGGMYKSKMNPESFIASITTWLARYNCSVYFCREYTTPKLIYDLLYREMKERLDNL